MTLSQASTPSSLDLTALQPAISAAHTLRQRLTDGLLERDEAVHAALVALIAREHLILIGPPGTAKSLLVNLLASAITDRSNGQELSLFSYLMTRFTTPEDLYGPISLEAYKQGRYLRVTKDRLPEAKLVFLDEVLRGSDPILDTLLTAMNERLFDNDGQRLPIPLMSLFGATNNANVPSSTDGKIGAVWDRFLLRLRVDYVSPANFVRMLYLPQAPQPTSPSWGLLTEDALALLQEGRLQVVIPAEIVEMLGQLRHDLLTRKIVLSDRRWFQSLSLLQANALLAGRGMVETGDLRILAHALWQKLEQSTEIGRLIVRLVAPYESEVLEIVDHAESVITTLHTTQNASDLDEQTHMQAAMEAMGKLRTGLRQLDQIRKQMVSTHLGTEQVDRSMADLKRMITDVSELIVSPTI